MNKIIECIPNFSEGKRQDVIDAISNAANSVLGAKLINVNVDPSYNRCVHTIVGEPEAVLEATFRACQGAVEKIDMNFHHGEHPRIGAIDASPIVPVENVTIEECVEYANRLGERIFRELEVPVYLYEKAAKKKKESSCKTFVIPSTKDFSSSSLSQSGFRTMERRNCILPPARCRLVSEVRLLLSTSASTPQTSKSPKRLLSASEKQKVLLQRLVLLVFLLKKNSVFRSAA